MNNSDSLTTLAGQVVQSLKARGLFVSTAESCTGGWIAKALTDIDGSSGCLGFGVVSYSNKAKESLLGVRPQTLLKHGAVSDAVVREMAAGAARISAADTAIAVSGVAGPTGGTAEKPVGTVWVAWQIHERVDTQLFHFAGDRLAVREQTVVAALSGLLERVSLERVGQDDGK